MRVPRYQGHLAWALEGRGKVTVCVSFYLRHSEVRGDPYWQTIWEPLGPSFGWLSAQAFDAEP